MDRILCELFLQHIITWQSKIKSHKNKLFGLPIFIGLRGFLPFVLEGWGFFFEISAYIGQEHLKENCNN